MRLQPAALIAATSTFLGVLSAVVAAPPAEAVAPRLSAPTALQVERATNPLGIATATPRLSWKDSVASTNAAQVQLHVQVARTLADLNAGANLFWDSTQPSAATEVAYTGRPLLAGDRYYWHVSVQDDAGTWSPSSVTAFWQEGQLSDADWAGADWIGTNDTSTAAPQFRSDFVLPTTSSPIQWATVTVAGLGINVVRLNGQPVDQNQLDAAYTNYSKRILSVTHNIAPSQLRAGAANTVGVALGSGWYGVQQSDAWQTQNAPWRGPEMFRLLLTVRYDDGSTAKFTSGTAGHTLGGTVWQTSSSETTWNSPYGGESVDLRKAQAGWDAPGFAPSVAWSGVISRTPPAGAVLTPQVMPAMQKAAPVSVGAPTNPAPRTWVYTLPTEVTGWAKINITGTVGQVVSVDYDETLAWTGTVSKMLNYKVTDADPRWQHDEFTLTGRADVLEPRFTYKGVKYLQISGVDTAPPPSAITVYPVYTALPADGSVTTSDPLLNAVHDIDKRTLLNNIQGVQTDCPTREKMPWLADLQLASDNANLNYDTAAFYEKVLADMRDAQQPSGFIPSIAPTPGWGNDGTYGDPWWGGAIISIAWSTYRYDGDRQALQDNYAAMASYLNYLRGISSGNLLTGAALADWIRDDATDQPFVSSAAYFMYAKLMSSTATVLGRTSDVSTWTALAASIRTAINNRWFDSTTHRYHDTSEKLDPGDTRSPHVTQTALGLAIALKIAPDDAVATVGAQLVDQLHADNRQLLSGIVGTKYVLQALDMIDRDDVAYDLIANNNGNSYAKMLNAGASTVWEGWDAAGQSQNHPALTSVEGWIYQAVAGIQTDLYSTQHDVTIAPNVTGPVTSANATVSTPTGQITTNWALTSGAFQLTVTVPAMSSVTVSLPHALASSVTKDGAPAAAAQQGERAVITGVTTGTHVFTSAFASPDLARGAAVTASSSVEVVSWSTSLLTDGRNNSYLDPAAASLGYHSQDGDPNQNDTQWVQVDLGSSKAIGSVTLWPSTPSRDIDPHPTGWGFPVDFRIETSNSPNSGFSVAASVAGLANPGATPQTYGVNSSARYVRVTATKLGATRNGMFALSLAELTVRAPATNSLRQVASGKCATADIGPSWWGASVTLQPCATSASDPLWRAQQLKLSPNASGSWTVTVPATGACFDTAGASTENGALIVTGGCNVNSTTQRWQMNGPWATVQNVGAGRNIDTNYARTDDGSALVIGNSTAPAPAPPRPDEGPGQTQEWLLGRGLY